MYSFDFIDDLEMMKKAVCCAVNAAEIGEVPVGAVLVDASGEILAAEGNNCIEASDPVGHAEMRVLRAAAKRMGNYRLPGTTMYVTLEPCAMCAAAMVHARIERVVFGAFDPKTGAIVSQYAIGSDGKLNHTFSVTSGILQERCSALLTDFFRKRR